MSRRQPAWRSEPLVTFCDGGFATARGPLGARDIGGGRHDGGGGSVMRVAAANRAAEAAAGIVPGLALADARARLPDLRAVPAAGAADMEALAALGDWCGRWTPWVALDAAGPHAVLGAGHGLWLDITGCAHLFGGEAALLNDMARRLARFGFAARAALADTPGAAWAVSHHGAAKRERARHGHVVAPGKTGAALAKLPLKGLRLAAAEADGLERLGFRAIGDLYGIPRGALARRFGEGVMRRLDQALGREDEPLSPRRPVAPHRVRQDFAEPIASREAIAVTARRLLGELAGVLEAAGQGARRLELTLYRGDGKVERIAVGTSAPVRAPSHLMRLLAEPLGALDAGFGFDSVALAASICEALAPAQLALDRQTATTQSNLLAQDGTDNDNDSEVARLIDRLGGRLGLANVRRLALFQSHIPERAALSGVAAAPPPSAQISHWPAGRQRPLRLLPRPEAVEAVAMLPDAPPLMFRWRRMLHRVTKAEGPERIAAEWWHAEGAQPLGGEADSMRDYYRVEDDRGRRFWLYRDAPYRPGMAPGWWLHGLFG
ncbi:MAG: DNA polymerase Y family protein [Alphaproteobacteria bacterium]|nr:DNA polymerase Y family protein [Alphaproteobacteria bacterium]